MNNRRVGLWGKGSSGCAESNRSGYEKPLHDRVMEDTKEQDDAIENEMIKLDELNKCKATTAMALHFTGGVALGVDKRSSNEPNDPNGARPRHELIIYDKVTKWFVLRSKIILLMVGDSEANLEMKEFVLKQFHNTGEMKEKEKLDPMDIDDGHIEEVIAMDIDEDDGPSVEDVVSVVMDYMNNGRQKKADMSVIIGGWSNKNQKLEIHFLELDEKGNAKDSITPGCIAGSGAKYALDVFDEMMKTNEQTRQYYDQHSSWEKIEDVITSSIFTASLYDTLTGGGYYVFKLTRDKLEVVLDSDFLENCYTHSRITPNEKTLLLAISDAEMYEPLTRGYIQSSFGAKYAHRIAHLGKTAESNDGFYLHRLLFDTDEEVKRVETCEVHGESQHHFQSLFPYRVKSNNISRPDYYLNKCTPEFLSTLKATCKELHPRSLAVDQYNLK